MKKTMVAMLCALLASTAFPLMGAEMDALQLDPAVQDVEGYNNGVKAGQDLMDAALNRRDDDFLTAFQNLYDPGATVYKNYRSNEKGAFWKGVAIAVDAAFHANYREGGTSGLTLINYTYHDRYTPSQSDTYWIVRLLQTQYNQTYKLDSSEYTGLADPYDARTHESVWPKRIMACYYFWLKTLAENIYTPGTHIANEGGDVKQMVSRNATAFMEALINH